MWTGWTRSRASWGGDNKTTPDRTYYYDKTVVTGNKYTYYVSAYDDDGQEGEVSKGLKVTAGAYDECPRIENVTPVAGKLTGTEKKCEYFRDTFLLRIGRT